MSYSIYLRDADGNDVADDLPNPTYNLTPIFDRALTGEDLPNPEVGEAAVVLLRTPTDRPRGLRLLSGLTGHDSIPLLERALEAMDRPDPYELLELEPANGWGTLAGAIECVRRMLTAARSYPLHVWEIH